MTPEDALFRRITIRALGLTVAGMAIAWVVPRGGTMAAIAVLGGAALAGGSLWAVRRSVIGIADALVAPAAGPEAERGAARAGRGVLGFLVRYALLGGIAYSYDCAFAPVPDRIAGRRERDSGCCGAGIAAPAPTALNAVREQCPNTSF